MYQLLETSLNTYNKNDTIIFNKYLNWKVKDEMEADNDKKCCHKKVSQDLQLLQGKKIWQLIFKKEIATSLKIIQEHKFRWKNILLFSSSDDEGEEDCVTMTVMKFPFFSSSGYALIF